MVNGFLVQLLVVLDNQIKVKQFISQSPKNVSV
jgi:hypothetical protein